MPLAPQHHPSLTTGYTHATPWTHTSTPEQAPALQCIHTLDYCTHTPLTPPATRLQPTVCKCTHKQARPIALLPHMDTQGHCSHRPLTTHRHTQGGTKGYGPRYRCTGRPSLGSLCKATRLPSCLPAHVTMTRDYHTVPSLIRHGTPQKCLQGASYSLMEAVKAPLQTPRPKGLVDGTSPIVKA
jgi:hypothetical protein